MATRISKMSNDKEGSRALRYRLLRLKEAICAIIGICFICQTSKGSIK